MAVVVPIEELVAPPQREARSVGIVLLGLGGVVLTGLYIGTVRHGSLKGTGRDITTPGAAAVSWAAAWLPR